MEGTVERGAVGVHADAKVEERPVEHGLETIRLQCGVNGRRKLESELSGHSVALRMGERGEQRSNGRPVRAGAQIEFENVRQRGRRHRADPVGVVRTVRGSSPGKVATEHTGHEKGAPVGGPGVGASQSADRRPRQALTHRSAGSPTVGLRLREHIGEVVGQIGTQLCDVHGVEIHQDACILGEVTQGGQLRPRTHAEHEPARVAPVNTSAVRQR